MFSFFEINFLMCIALLFKVKPWTFCYHMLVCVVCLKIIQYFKKLKFILEKIVWLQCITPDYCHQNSAGCCRLSTRCMT